MALRSALGSPAALCSADQALSSAMRSRSFSAQAHSRSARASALWLCTNWRKACRLLAWVRARLAAAATFGRLGVMHGRGTAQFTAPGLAYRHQVLAEVAVLRVRTVALAIEFVVSVNADPHLVGLRALHQGLHGRLFARLQRGVCSDSMAPLQA